MPHKIKNSLSIDQIKKNLFLPDIPDEEIIWNIGVLGLKNAHRGEMRYYLKSALDRLQKYEEKESRYNWRSGCWTKALMRRLVPTRSVGTLVIDPNIVTSSIIARATGSR